MDITTPRTVTIDTAHLTIDQLDELRQFLTGVQESLTGDAAMDMRDTRFALLDEHNRRTLNGEA